MVTSQETNFPAHDLPVRSHSCLLVHVIRSSCIGEYSHVVLSAERCMLIRPGCSDTVKYHDRIVVAHLALDNLETVAQTSQVRVRVRCRNRRGEPGGNLRLEGRRTLAVRRTYQRSPSLKPQASRNLPAGRYKTRHRAARVLARFGGSHWEPGGGAWGRRAWRPRGGCPSKAGVARCLGSGLDPRHSGVDFERAREMREIPGPAGIWQGGRGGPEQP